MQLTKTLRLVNKNKFEKRNQFNFINQSTCLFSDYFQVMNRNTKFNLMYRVNELSVHNVYLLLYVLKQAINISIITKNRLDGSLTVSAEQHFIKL